MIRLAVATLGLALIAAGARAQEAIPTAAGGPQSIAPAPVANDPIRLRDHHDSGDDIVRSVGPCGGVAKADGKPDRSPHGEAYAGVGTHGYREAGGIVCAPLGDHAAATIAVDVAHVNGWRR